MSPSLRNLASNSLRLAFTFTPYPTRPNPYVLRSTRHRYLIFILLSIILLLNLLIAMLSFTFKAVREESTLKCRLSFAQYILRLEMYAKLMGLDTQVGGLSPDGRRVYEFRAVEGGGKGGGEDPFRDEHDLTLDDLKGEITALDDKLTKVVSLLTVSKLSTVVSMATHAHQSAKALAAEVASPKVRAKSEIIIKTDRL